MIPTPEIKVSRTLQVEFDGQRLTAHYYLDGSNEWALREVSSNVAHVRVELIKHLMLLAREHYLGAG